MPEAKVSLEASDALLYALGVAFSERHGVHYPDSNLVKWNGGTCLALYESAMHIIVEASKPKV